LLDAQSVTGATEQPRKKVKSSSFLQTAHDNSSERQPTVAMLLSGGVDSSVAMHLLLRQKYNVTAFYLRIWLEDELAHLGECPWEDDLRICQSVCEHAGNITLETVSLGKEYRERVVQYTIEEAQRGRTPNPDIMCNSRIKFGCFLEYIEKSGLDFDFVASGHYARLEDAADSSLISPKKRLFRAPDPIKDQSYFLCALTQKQLSKVIFPIGMYQKAKVRELANEFQLPNRNRPDSQGLCFLGKVKFDEFLASYLGNRPGDVVDAMTGDIIGRHNGLWYHTVGQRKGIGKVMFPLATAHGPWYVVAKDQERDVVYVSNRYDEDDFARARSEFELEDIKWISGTPPLDTKSNDIESSEWREVRFDLKIRHGPKIVMGTLTLNGDGSTGNVCLDNKDGGLAPGQYVVFYRIGTLECLGAGVISERHWAKFLQTHKAMPITEEHLEKR
jgi:tRNA-specific 2-thiouridylase